MGPGVFGTVGGRSGSDELSDGLLGAGVVDEALVVGGGGHEGGGGGVVEGSGQPVGVAVQPRRGIVGYERVAAPAMARWWRR